jgi:CRP/FNR family cyclic AMP-dependent transcriptional regulator
VEDQRGNALHCRIRASSATQGGEKHDRDPDSQRKLADLNGLDVGRRWWNRNRNGVSETAVAALDDLSAKLGYLSETNIFATLSDEEREWLANNATMITCQKGKVFYTPDEQGEVAFILKRGRVDLYRIAPDGRKLVVGRLGPRAIFGEMGFIGQRMYGCYAEAAEECLICVMSRNMLETLVRRNPDVGLRLLAELGNRLQQREAELESLAFRALPVRLADLLLEEMDSFGVVAGYTHQDLADRLGAYRETVSQTLGRFRAERLVEVEPRRVRVIDRAGLQAYVNS